MGQQRDLSEALNQQLRLIGLRPIREYHFHPVRRWRIDLVLLEARIAIECEGGIWQGGKGGGRNQRGGHTGGRGYVKDIEKYNEITLAGWRLLRVTGGMIDNGEALTLIERALALTKGAADGTSADAAAAAGRE